MYKVFRSVQLWWEISLANLFQMLQLKQLNVLCAKRNCIFKNFFNKEVSMKKWCAKLFKIFYLCIFRERERGEERERNINVWLPLDCPLLGTWPTIQACALTENWTSDSLLCSQLTEPHQPGLMCWIFTYVKNITFLKLLTQLKR